jgi:putative transposase
MYEWRKLNERQRDELLSWRRTMRYPWHSPPHRTSDRGLYHITAACYLHQPVIGYSPARMSAFSDQLLASLGHHASAIHAWCVLPNHYHAMIATPDILSLLAALGKLHGRTSYTWNGEENRRGRQIWCKAAERDMRSDRHRWATLNYVHHNPVHHGYARRWQDWPYSSAREYLASVGRAEAQRAWREYPVRDYGKGWDAPDL